MKSDAVESRLMNLWIALLLIASVGAVIYSNIYRVPFVFDGIRQIEDKPKIRNLENYFSLKEVFSPRPVVEVTFALNYKFGKLNVIGYHLVNVLIHIINGFLVYFLALNIFKRLLNPPAQRFGLSNSPKSEVQGSQFAISQSTIDNRQSSIYLMSLFSALVFVAHPIQTQAVTYTVQRYTSMATLFYLLSIFCYVKARILQQGAENCGQWSGDSGQGIVVSGQGSERLSAFSFQLSAWFLISIICGMLAFLSKPSMASIPGAILLAEYILFDRTWRGWKRKLLWFAPIFGIMGVFILYVSGIFRGEVQFGKLLEDVSGILQAPGTNVSRWIYLCTQFNVISIYIGLLFLPINQNLDYLYPFKTGFFDGYTPAAFLLLTAIVVLAICNVKKRPVITFGVFWFFITLSVESSIFPIKDAMFEHRLYLPMFGFSLVLSYLLFYLLPVKRQLSIVLSVIVVVALGSATYLRNRTYQNGITLWSDVVSKSPQNFRAHYNLGNALRNHGYPEEAIKSYSRSIEIRPGYAEAYDNLGVALTEGGRFDDAIRHFSAILGTRSQDPMIHSNLGLALMRKGNFQEAISHFSKALRLKPNYAEAHNNLGITLAQQGNLKDAVRHFSEALQVEPNNHRIHCNVGQALMLQGHLQGSAFHFSEAIRIKPEYAEAQSGLGFVLMRQGEVDKGIAHFSKALDINPQFAPARDGLQKALRLKARTRAQPNIKGNPER